MARPRFHLAPRVLYRLWHAALLASPLLLSAGASLAFDADHDGIDDSADAYPCSAELSSAIFSPAQGEHGLLLFEDQWPADSDLDFNDVALSYNYAFQLNRLGQVVAIKATFNPLAVGGVFNNGVGLHLSVPTAAVESIHKTIGHQASTVLNPSAQDSELTIRLSDNIRELFGNREGTINSHPSQAPLTGEPLVIDITFSAPVTLDTGAAPFDVYIFRTEQPSLEIHRPEFAGTASMNQSLFGSGHDRSTLNRHFVDERGLPYALHLPTVGLWAKEGTPIEQLYPDILAFASSGGTAHQDFYASQVQVARAYSPANGMSPPRPQFLGVDHVPAQTGCVTAWGLAVDFGSSRNQFAYGSTMDAEGNVYVTGYVRGAFPGLTSAGGLDLFVAKYDGKTGAELWVKQFGGSGDETGRDIAIDSDGMIYITGESSSALGGQSNSGASDAFLMKLSPEGNSLWTRLLGGSGQDTAYGLALSPQGGIFIGGGSTSPNLQGASFPGNSPNSFLARYDASGNRVWVQQYLTDSDDTSNYNYTLDIAVDPISGDVYSVGAERRYNQSANAAENQFLVKSSGQDGHLLWTRHIGDYGYVNSSGDYRYGYAYSVSADEYEGSAYLTGYWYGGPSTGSWGDWTRIAGDSSADATLSKFDSQGNAQWSYTIASPDGKDDFGEAIIGSGELSGVYFTGRTAGSLPGFTNQGGDDYFMVAYDYSGNQRWLVQGGTGSNDVGHIAVIDTHALSGSGAQQNTYPIYVVSNTTGALPGPDGGHYEIGITRHNYINGISDAQVIAGRVGWSYDAWSTCSASCGGGTQTRNVFCASADGTHLADNYCVDTKPSSVQACNPLPCYSYAWKADSWGSCSASCGGGTQSRRVYCQRSDGAEVADSFCTGVRPDSLLACNTQSCYSYSWYTGAFGSCSLACGSGLQSRTVYCLRNDGAQVTDSYCSGSKPALSQVCNTMSCGEIPTTADASCKTHRAQGFTSSGIYWIDPDGPNTGLPPFQVRCDMSTDGGGWIVFQRRVDGTVDFYRNWASYKTGFGSISSNYWLGNETLYRFTSRYNSELRIDMVDAGAAGWAKFSTFAIGSEATYYSLTATGFTGNVGDALSYHNGRGFSTYDYGPASGCASTYTGAWWYGYCHDSNLNGQYGNNSYARGLSWDTWRGYYDSIDFVEMKMRER